MSNKNLNKSFQKALSPTFEMLLNAFSYSGFSGYIDPNILKTFIENEKLINISFTNTKKREITDFEKGFKNLEKMRTAIKSIKECIDFNKNSHEIYFRSCIDTEIDDFQKDWEQKCENLKKSLFDIPPPKKNPPIWHEIASFYFCFYCAVTNSYSFSRSGPAVRFVSSMLGGDISPASIEGALNKWKKKLSFSAHNSTIPMWKISIQIMAENFSGLTQK